MVEGLWHMWMFGCRRAKEKRLFHGNEKATIPTINRKSFNRSFCGKNTTAYAKGVYFPVDPSYSIDDTCSRPDSQGNKLAVRA
jgi:hypothetical protein